jgi:hypothetical protein
MELTAACTPFVYIPLRHHFEQHFTGCTAAVIAQLLSGISTEKRDQPTSQKKVRPPDAD